MSKRIVSAILCLALVVAMAVPAFAATTTLYSRTNAGYRITGTANVSSSYASTTMTASEVSGTPLKPIEEYSDSVVSITAYDKAGNKIGTARNYGYPTLTTVLTGTTTSIYRAEFTHTFNNTTYGYYTLYA